jgi:heme A synthase
MAHRFFALIVLGIVLAASHRAFYHARHETDALAQWLAVAAVLMTAGQVLLGAASIWRFLSIPLVTAHLSLAALLLTNLMLLRMRLARVPATLAPPS